jgi:O-antigen/teichoic acid export membrane protein
LVAITIMFSSSLGSVMLPALSAVSDDPQRMSRNYLKTISLTSFLSAGLFAGLAALSADLIIVILGSKWKDVAPIVSILAVNGYISSLSQYDSNVMLIKGKADWNLGIMIVSALANVVLFVIVGRLGLVVLAAAYVLKNMLLFPLPAAAALRLLHIKYRQYLAEVAPSIVAALLMVAAVTFAKEHLSEFAPAVRVCILTPFGAAFYVLAMMILGRDAVLEVVSMLRQLRKD